MTHWIKISNQFPPIGITVLGLNRNGEIRVVRFDPPSDYDIKCDRNFSVSNEGMDACGCCDSFDKDMTHWMPLLTPPEDENGE